MKVLWKEICVAILMGTVLPSLILNISAVVLEGKARELPIVENTASSSGEGQAHTPISVRLSNERFSTMDIEKYITGVVLGEMPADFEPELIRYENTEANLNSAACSAFIQMRDHISERFDSRLLIMSAYRSRDKQLEIYNEDNDGTAAKPGESEHETGLGIDVYVKYFAGKGFLKSDVGKYVNKNCGKFGFIIRYPSRQQSHFIIDIFPAL